MRRLSPLIAVPIAALMLVTAAVLVDPVPEAGAQPAAPSPTAKPAGAATAPRAGGIPLELAGALVAGGSVLTGTGLYALRRRKR